MGILAVSLPIVGGCAPPARAPVRIAVDHPTDLVDAPLAVTVIGLNPAQIVTLRATTTDARGQLFASEATFAATSTGELDLAKAKPRSGSYGNADAMGLLWSLAPPEEDNLQAADFSFSPAGASMQVTLSVHIDGHLEATQTLNRLMRAPGVAETELRPEHDGFFGDYFAPSVASPRKAAVVLLGGSEGGLDADVEAGQLASHGFPTLDLAYFREPGLPQTLSDIPLEYFVKALTWLTRQRGVNVDHVVVSGVSRGSEAALLLGVHYPKLIHGVIALVPSNVANCNRPACNGPAWLLGGAPLPYTLAFGETNPSDQPAAVIPVERIQGGILLSCGGKDNVWASCAYSAAIQGRLDSFGFIHAHQLLGFPNAGHEIANAMPYLPSYSNLLGGSAAAEALARVQQWQHILTFLAAA